MLLCITSGPEELQAKTANHHVQQADKRATLSSLARTVVQTPSPIISVNAGSHRFCSALRDARSALGMVAASFGRSSSSWTWSSLQQQQQHASLVVYARVRVCLRRVTSHQLHSHFFGFLHSTEYCYEARTHADDVQLPYLPRSLVLPTRSSSSLANSSAPRQSSSSKYTPPSMMMLT